MVLFHVRALVTRGAVPKALLHCMVLTCRCLGICMTLPLATYWQPVLPLHDSLQQLLSQRKHVCRSV